MRKILLGTASALALGLFATSAMAGTDDYWNHSYGKSSTDNTSVAVGAQINSVTNDGDIVIGSQAETHSKTIAAAKKDDGKGHHGGGGYPEANNSNGGNHDSGGSSFFYFASYDHNDEGRVYNSNSIDGSFTGAVGLINVNQNNGNNVSQDAQNTVAAILGCDCGDSVGGHHGNDNGGNTDNVAVAVGLQASYVSNGSYANIVVDVATQSNLITGSFNDAVGLINVNQNNGNNVSQKAQNTVAAIIAKK